MNKRKKEAENLIYEILEAKDLIYRVLLGCLIAVFILVIITTFFGGS